MDSGVVQEQVDLLVTAGISDLLQEADELWPIEAELLYCEGEELMTCTDCSTDSLTGLVASAVLNHNVGIRRCPSKCLKASRRKDGFICKDEMSVLCLDALDKVIQRHRHVLEFFETPSLVLWCLTHYYLLLPVSSLTQYRAQSLSPNPPVWELAVKLDAPRQQGKMSPGCVVLVTGEVLKLLRCDVGLGDQSSAIRLCAVLRYKETLPCRQSLLEVLRVQVCNSVQTQTNQLSDEGKSESWRWRLILARLFGAVPEVQYLLRLLDRLVVDSHLVAVIIY